ncbi:alpha/beta-Hydrolases superfamily protein [Rhynchospora pubera]|uniref:Alpha/beta-Hydrolases superfamily protein n=1 Tax=Rhynchospora pubera TaxID=906938 RepID=A0AAV8CHG5_9POAL|nr:alpha/beta-Hydrolases superfamily protein [Rhynchospora pubera]
MDQLVNFIIRPPRADYSPKDDLLEEEFRLRRKWYRRKDLEVINGQGKKLKCSHYLPLIIPEGKSLPCVIYCHGNSGCRADASEVAIILLPSNITVFTLDFSGSGLSEGEHVTLGWNEKEDLKAVVNHLRSDGSVSCIGLWGRSMGAVTSLMYGAEDPSIAGMVLDSPFSNLVELMMELVDMYKYPLPKFTVKLAIQHMRKIIKKKANFDIMDLDTIEVAKRSFVPVLFGHAIDDDFIQPHHSERICDAYMGDKNIIKFEGDHNSPRPQFYFDSVTIFFHNVLNPPDDLPEDDDILPEDSYFNQDIGYRNPSYNGSLTGNGAVTTEDAIAQLRSRRLMSRVEVPSGTPTDEKSDISDGPSSSVPSHANLTPMMEDAEFLDCSFDSYSGIPCTIEDEERMLMEAIMASLKDVKVESTQGEEDGKSNFVDALSASPPDKTNLSDGPSSSSTDVPNHDTKAIGEDSKNNTSTDSNPASSAEMPDGTRATLVVQRSRSGTIMDGLTQKFGFSFFKNNSRDL